MTWNHAYAQRMQNMKSSAIRELLKLTEKPEIISFAGGLPAPEVFPIDEINVVTQRLLQTNGVQALQYHATEGYRPLRNLLAEQIRRDTLPVGVENILITSGSQQALDMLGKILLDPGDLILVENPTYVGALQAWSAYQPSYIALPTDDNGVVLDGIEEYLQRRPKFLYVQPNFQNPGGVSLSLERRRKLVELAQRYQVLIIEDDPYSRLRFEGEALPTLLEIAGSKQGEQKEQGTYQGNVILLNTFSKTLAPGLRVGSVVAPSEIIARLVQTKQGTDLQTSTLNQMIAYEVMHNGFLEQHIPFVRDTYRTRRDAMLGALDKYFPQEVHWTHPAGGMFLWVTLPEQMDSTLLLAEALKQDVAFVPGTDFHARGGGENTLRLNFSNAAPESIQQGIARLGRVVQKELVRSLANIVN